MGEQIQINRLGERFSSHTQTRPRPHVRRTPRETEQLREQLLAAAVEVLIDGGDPRLAWTRALP